jgi:3-phenylpropionate/cinnamic acid dioxygenase small subunit
MSTAGLVQQNAEAAQWRAPIEEFHVRYCDALDSARFDEWPSFFTDDAFYNVLSRENYDLGLPLGVFMCDGKPMFLDRIAALEALVYAPRYLRHFVSNIMVLKTGHDGAVEAQSNYLVTQTAIDEETKVFQSGRYLDEFVPVGGTLKLRRRLCIYDSLLIQNTIMFPV